MEVDEKEFDIKDFVDEKNILINISMEKIIYYPGEEIKGFVYIKGKSSLSNPLFIYSLVKVNISQIFYYNYEIETKYQTDTGEEKLKLKIPFLDNVKELENQVLYSTVFNYSQYLGHNLINGIKLPFQLILPNNLEPTFNFNNSFIRHILTFDFYNFESKNSVGIIIKNRRCFSLENKSLKEPLTVFKDMTKNKFIFLNQGKIAVYIKSKSNSYKYGDNIPLEINVDASELNINLIGIQIRFDRFIQYNDINNKKNPKEVFTHNLFCKDIKYIEKQINYKNSVVIVPKHDDFCNQSNLFYSIIEGNYLKLNFPEINILPFCHGGLINCFYVINVKLCFDSMATTNETISIPIELYFKEKNNNNQNNENKIHNPYNEIFKDEDNDNNELNNVININSLSGYFNNKKEENGFEIIEEEDFIKALNKNNSNSKI